VGWASGYAFKQFGKAAALVCGSMFICLQFLAYKGYITIVWKKWVDTAQEAADLNNDGKVDAADLKAAFSGLMKVLKYGLPSSAGFTAGFVLGLKQG